MKIAFITDWFAEEMGYAENALPKAMAALGHQVHVVTSTLLPYGNSKTYTQIYGKFLGPAERNRGTKQIDGYTVHRLPWKNSRICGGIKIKGLLGKLREISPHIVQTFDISTASTLQAILGKCRVSYELFVGCHIHASVFPRDIRGLGHKVRAARAKVMAPIINSCIKTCYAISEDCASIAMVFFRIDRKKIKTVPLGVDVRLFKPPEDAASQHTRSKVRQLLRFNEEDIICIYTGRLSEDKGPLILARAIEHLFSKGNKFRGLFVGDGPQNYVQLIKDNNGCVVKSFVPYSELPGIYTAADIGVWPKQESTSQLDAAASGLPIILSDKIMVKERVDGNGLCYKEGDSFALASTIEALGNSDLRRKMGRVGAERIRRELSWDVLAQKRILDYEEVLKSQKRD